MSDPVEFKDLSPPSRELTADDEAWLKRLQSAVNAGDHVIRTRESDPDIEELVVYTDRYGHWRAGRYVGTLTFEGRRLEIRPRLGMATLAEWATHALHLVSVPKSVLHEESESFIAWFLGLIWGRAVADAARHGLPSLKTRREHEGLILRGRLDVRRTVTVRRRDPIAVASTSVERSLRNDVSRTLVLAERTLSRWIGEEAWMPKRVHDLMPQLRAAVGSRPELPTRQDLRRIRYTPITRPFEPVVEMSHRLARQEGFVAGAKSGAAEGLLLDVAELWELFVLAATRRATHSRVTHSARASEEIHHLLRSEDGRTPLGRLKPDIVVWDGQTPKAVVDAKYKRLAPSAEVPTGVTAEDLYQLSAYVGRLRRDDPMVGVLAYPRDPDQTARASAEVDGPWRTSGNDRIHFARLPIDSSACEAALLEILEAQP